MKYAHDIHNRLVSLCKHLSSSLHVCRVIVSIVSRIKNTHYVNFSSVFILKVSCQETDATFSTENVLGPKTRNPVQSALCFLNSTAAKEHVIHSGSVGIAPCCKLKGPGIKCRSQWPSGLRRGSAADRLLGLRVRIPPRTWMFVLCVLYSKEQKAKPGQSGQKVQIKHT